MGQGFFLQPQTYKVKPWLPPPQHGLAMAGPASARPGRGQPRLRPGHGQPRCRPAMAGPDQSPTSSHSFFACMTGARLKTIQNSLRTRIFQCLDTRGTKAPRKPFDKVVRKFAAWIANRLERE